MKHNITRKAGALCGRVWRNWVRPMGVMAAIILPVKSSLADMNWVPTGSMKPTILEGDLIGVNKLAYDLKVPFTLVRLAEWSAPHKGDIVVLFSPEDGTRLVKRVVAGPGDTIEMRGNVVILNGKPLEYQVEDAAPFLKEVYEDTSPVVARESLGDTRHRLMALPHRMALRSFPPVVIPEGRYFVMGDSRDNSKDSRFIGLIDRRQIVGKADYSVASLDLKHWCLPRFSRFFSKLDG